MFRNFCSNCSLIYGATAIAFATVGSLRGLQCETIILIRLLANE